MMDMGKVVSTCNLQADLLFIFPQTGSLGGRIKTRMLCLSVASRLNITGALNHLSLVALSIDHDHNSTDKRVTLLCSFDA